MMDAGEQGGEQTSAPSSEAAVFLAKGKSPGSAVQTEGSGNPHPAKPVL